MLREGGHCARDARAFRIVHRNHISKPHPRHHLTSSRSPESQGRRAGVGGDRARPEWRPRAPAKETNYAVETARENCSRKLLAIRSGAERSGNRDGPIKPDRFPRCTSATRLTCRRARVSGCFPASTSRMGRSIRRRDREDDEASGAYRRDGDRTRLSPRRGHGPRRRRRRIGDRSLRQYRKRGWSGPVVRQPCSQRY